MKNSVSRVNVNGMCGYCVEAETEADAVKMLNLYRENERLRSIIADLENECAELEVMVNEMSDFCW